MCMSVGGAGMGGPESGAGTQQSIFSNTFVKGSDDDSHKLAHKKWGHGQKQTRDNLKDNKNIVHIDDTLNPCLTFSKVELARARMAGKTRLRKIWAEELAINLIVKLLNKIINQWWFDHLLTLAQQRV